MSQTVPIFGSKAVRASELFCEPLTTAVRGRWEKISREEGIALLEQGVQEQRLKCEVSGEALVDLFFEALDRQVRSFEEVVDRNEQADVRSFARHALVTLTAAFMARGLASPEALDEAFATLGAIEQRVARLQVAHDNPT